MQPALYVKRPGTVEAWQWDGRPETADLIVEWIEGNGGFASIHPHEQLIILGDKIAPIKPTDWVVRDKFNDFWPLGNDLFPGVYMSMVN